MDLKSLIPLFVNYKGDDFYQKVREAENFDQVLSSFLKELYIISELAGNGASVKLNKVLGEAIDNSDFNSYVSRVSSFLVFGDEYEVLDEEQKKYIDQGVFEGKCRQHWLDLGDDCMFLRSGEESFDKEALRKCLSKFGDLLSNIIDEREKLGHTNVRNEYFFNNQGSVTVDEKHGVLRKRDYSNIAAYLNVEGEITEDITKELLSVFEGYLEEHSFEVSAALVDFYTYLSRKGGQYGFEVVQEYYKDQKRMLSIFNVGSNSVMITRSRKGMAFYSNLLYKFITNQGFEKSFIGDLQPLNYGIVNTEIEERGEVVMMSSDATECFNDMHQEDIEKILNWREEGEVISLKENIESHLRAQGVKDDFVVFNLGVARKVKENKLVIGDLEKAIKAIDFSFLYECDSGVNIEAGYVYADWPLNFLEFNGVHAAVILANQVTSNCNQQVETYALVDEYNAANCLDFKAYQKRLKELGFNPDKIVVESSPLVMELAIDILKHFITEEKASPSYSLHYDDKDIYLRYTADNSLIELVRTIGDKLKIGCVLFDVALSLYKRYPEMVEGLYLIEEGLDPNLDIHKNIISIYEKSKSPKARLDALKKKMQIKKYTLEGINERINYRPYIKTIETAKMSGGSKALVRVMESYFKPREERVNKLLEILGEAMITTIYMGEKGEVELCM